MLISLLTTKSESNSFPKNFENDRIVLEGSFRDESNLINPRILIEYHETFNPTKEKAFKYNYCYIPDFNRFYFINDVRVVRTGVYELIMHVDVLQTYRNDIKKMNGFCKRSESHGDENLYYDDKANIPNVKYIWYKEGTSTDNKFLHTVDKDSLNIVLITTGTGSAIT